MWKWFRKKIEIEPTEEAILHALAQYALGEPNRDFCNKVAEVNTMMNNKAVSDPIQRDAIDKALKAWANKESTPVEYKSMFRKAR